MSWIKEDTQRGVSTWYLELYSTYCNVLNVKYVSYYCTRVVVEVLNIYDALMLDVYSCHISLYDLNVHPSAISSKICDKVQGHSKLRLGTGDALDYSWAILF